MNRSLIRKPGFSEQARLNISFGQAVTKTPNSFAYSSVFLYGCAAWQWDSRKTMLRKSSAVTLLLLGRAN